MEKLLLIDGNSLINRAFYAMPLLSTNDGVFTNAVYGFMNMFFKVLDSEKPTAVAVAFDLKAPTFRHKMFDGYKATRKPMPVELRPQIPLLKELLKEMNVTVIEKEGFEADDIIGTIAKNTAVKTIIITGDKDSFQLVDHETEVHFTKRGITDTEVYNDKNFLEKTGIMPQQVIDLKSLMGDASDNIPGIAGVGEKTAKTLIQTYGNLDSLYQNVEELKGKLKEKIVNGKESAYLSRTLATIDVNSPIDTDVSKMAITLPFPTSVKKRFMELEFKSLYRRDELFADEKLDNKQESQQETAQISIKIASSVKQVSELKKSELLSVLIAQEGAFLCDGETELKLPVRASLLDDGFDLIDVLREVVPFINKKDKIVVFNKKDLKKFLSTQTGETLNCKCEDISIMKYLVDFTGRSESAKEVFEQYGLSQTTPAHNLLILYKKFSELLEKENLVNLYKDVELPLSDVLFEMEEAGFKIDVNALTLAGEKYKLKLAELEKEIRESTGEQTLNVNSPKQLGEVIFEKLKLGKGKKTKLGYSTSAEILESLEDKHPCIPLILNYRQLQKLHSTYIEGFKPLIDKNTGLIHTSFNQTMTATGRLSSKEPNLQNIPVRDDEGRELRRFFVSRDQNHILISADYSQIELRLLAVFSECQSLIQAFNLGKDVHSQTASKVFNTPLDKVTSAMRSSAKAVNFGIIYGISEYGLAKNLKISPSEARNYISSYFEEFPEVKAYMQKNVELAREKGYATTYLNRKRTIREINSPNYNLRSFGERVAMNMPLQGSAADVIKLAMINVSNRLKKEKLQSKLILQIHDELIIDALISEQKQVEKLLQEEMENAVNLSVKLTVNVGKGKNWFEAK